MGPPPDLDEGNLIVRSLHQPKQNIEVVNKKLQLAANCHKQIFNQETRKNPLIIGTILPVVIFFYINAYEITNIL